MGKVALQIGVLLGEGIFYGGKWIYNNYNKEKPQLEDPAEEEKKQAQADGQEPAYIADPNLDIESLTCPITMQVVRVPATTIYGHLFELSAIRSWVKAKGTCPLTQQPLREDQIYEQHGLKEKITAIREMNATTM